MDLQVSKISLPCGWFRSQHIKLLPASAHNLKNPGCRTGIVFKSIQTRAFHGGCVRVHSGTLSQTASAESHPLTPLRALWPERLSASGDTEPFPSNLLLLVDSHLLPPPADALQRRRRSGTKLWRWSKAKRLIPPRRPLHAAGFV